MPHRTTTPDDIKAMVRLHRQGLSYSAIGKKLGGSHTWVRKHLTEIGLATHSKAGQPAHLSREQIIEIFRLHAAGYINTDIARHVGCNVTSVGCVINEAGLERNGNHAFPPKRKKGWRPDWKRLAD